MSRRGRRTKLTKKFTQEFCNVIMQGNNIKTACGITGIEESTYYRWKKHHRDLQETQKKCPDVEVKLNVDINTKLLNQFFKSIKRSFAIAKQRNILLIQTKAKESWQAAAWWLERNFPEEYGRREKIESFEVKETYEERLRRLRSERGLPPIEECQVNG